MMIVYIAIGVVIVAAIIWVATRKKKDDNLPGPNSQQ